MGGARGQADCQLRKIAVTGEHKPRGQNKRVPFLHTNVNTYVSFFCRNLIYNVVRIFNQNSVKPQREAQTGKLFNAWW